MRNSLIISLFGLVLLGQLSGCTRPPTITSLDVNQGPDHTLVKVSGSSMFASRVVWDAGAPTETIIPGGFLGGYMLSIPGGASTGVHNIALSNRNGLSNMVAFTVTAPEPWSAP